jgi:hypothetical protein
LGVDAVDAAAPPPQLLLLPPRTAAATTTPAARRMSRDMQSALATGDRAQAAHGVVFWED